MTYDSILWGHCVCNALSSNNCIILFCVYWWSSSFLFVPLQLDPQTVQSKNWHMDVIEMNGVLIYFSLNILILLHYCLTQSFLWLMCDLSHYLISFQIKVEFSMKFTSRDLSLKRTPSKKQSGVFGVKISVVTKWVKYQALKSVWNENPPYLFSKRMLLISLWMISLCICLFFYLIMITVFSNCLDAKSKTALVFHLGNTAINTTLISRLPKPNNRVKTLIHNLFT